ncbi:2Fe-2S iron-sulfur cluster-binding protein [Natrialbaceae archaeon A-gly3]
MTVPATFGSDVNAESYAVTLVRRDGSEETITVEPGETITSAAERVRVSLPYGCLYGSCGTCTARMLEGEVVHLEPPRGLKPDALERGFVLTCIATPESDCRLRVGHDVQAAVMGTPWK